MPSIASPARPQIILDTDPGGDDTFALLWLQSLVKQGLADLIAVTTTAGNVSAEQTFANASQVLNLGGVSQIEVGRGVPLAGTPPEDASNIHGRDGLGNLSATLPPPTHAYATAPASDDLLIDRLTSHPGQITVIAIGPLTNLAAAEAKRPGILQLAREVVVMGGAFHCPGNVTPQAEFNLWFNPIAAQTVFNRGSQTVVLPLDVTRQLVFTQAMAQAVSQANPTHPIAPFLTALCNFMTGTALHYRETAGVSGFLVHDAVTLAYLFYPASLLLRRATVRVETQGEWTIGQTLIDDRSAAQPLANAWVALQVDPTRVFTSLIADLKVLLQ